MKDVFKIYVLHHPSLAERKKYLLSKFEEYLLDNIVWVDEIYPQDFLKNKIAHSKMDSKSTEVSYRHYICLENIFNGEQEYGIIFEDDVILELINKFNVKDFLTMCVKKMKENNIELCFPGMALGIGLPSTFNVTDLMYHHPGNATRCAHAYIISQKCAKTFIDNFNYDIPVDHMYNNIIFNNDIKSYYTYFGLDQGTIVGTYKSTIR
jgi:hypothetical protein